MRFIVDNDGFTFACSWWVVIAALIVWFIYKMSRLENEP